MRLLLVEDDAPLAAATVRALARRGLDCDRAGTLGDARQMLALAHYAALLIDLGLPDGEGLDLVRTLREERNPLPVLAITARGALEDRVAGLNSGADDYLIKPFQPDELVARLRAVLRRQALLSGGEVTIGNLRFDTATGEMSVAGELVELSRRERQLAQLLIVRAGQVVTKSLTEDQLFGLEEPPGSNAVEVYVHRLRRKLERANADVRIETVRGLGYLLRGPQ